MTFLSSNNQHKIPLIVIFLLLLLLITYTHGQIERSHHQGKCFATFTNQGNPAVSCTGYKTLPLDIPNPSQVRIVLMSGNNYLESITEGQLLRTNLSNLDTLNLRFCHISKIERGAFQGGERLTELSLSDNRITHLDPAVFKDLSSLQRLFIGNNPFSSFHLVDTFPSLKLKWLGLSDCGITKISSNLLKNLEDLEELYLHDNRMTTMDWKMFKLLPNLKWISLYGNPWNCDCHIDFILTYFAKNHISNYLLGNVNCSAAPDPSLVGATWNNLKFDRLICPPKISEFQVERWYKNEDVQIANLTCVYSGFPEPTVNWLKDGENIIDDSEEENSNTSKVDIDTTEPQEDNNDTKLQGTDDDDDDDERRFNVNFKQTLTVPNFSTGNYSCFVVNSKGNNDSKFRFLINNSSTGNYTDDTAAAAAARSSTGKLLLQQQILFTSSSSSSKPISTTTMSTGAAPNWVVVMESFIIILLVAALVTITIYFRRQLELLNRLQVSNIVTELNQKETTSTESSSSPGNDYDRLF